MLNKTIRPERVIQFGEGGFLRGFVDWILQITNEKTDFDGSVVEPRFPLCGVQHHRVGHLL